MMRSRVFTLCLSLAAATFAAGCLDEEEHASKDGSLNADGYALFEVENDRQQRNDVTVRIKQPDPDATYVLFYSPDPPKNVGWFQFDPSTRSRCGGDVGPHCQVGDYGYMVDVVKAGPNDPAKGSPAEVVLRDDRCGCDGDEDWREWKGYWAVLRVERLNHANAVAIEVTARAIEDYAEEPEIEQLE